MFHTDSFSKTQTESPVFEFPKNLLDKIRHITLADLLDNPASQCWTVSCLYNSCYHASSFEDDMISKDHRQIREMKAVVDKIPRSERQELFALIRQIKTLR